MKIVFIGSGNVATVLARLCVKNNHQVIQIISRNMAHAKILADEIGCAFIDYSGTINLDADVYIAAINDSVVFDLSKLFSLGSKLVVHTAGAVSKDVLQEVSSKYGILYPLQSMRKEIQAIPSIPFLIDGNSTESVAAIENFALTIAASVTKATDEARAKIHVAATVVNNFTNHLYAITEDFCAKENLDFKLLYPLITETSQRITSFSAKDVQTGPAFRNDVYTLDKHLRLLATHPKLKYLYLKLTDSIMNP